MFAAGLHSRRPAMGSAALLLFALVGVACVLSDKGAQATSRQPDASSSLLDAVTETGSAVLDMMQSDAMVLPSQQGAALATTGFELAADQVGSDSEYE